MAPLVTPARSRIASRSEPRKPDRCISSKAAFSRRSRVRLGLRTLGLAAANRFLLTYIRTSMYVVSVRVNLTSGGAAHTFRDHALRRRPASDDLFGGPAKHI